MFHSHLRWLLLGLIGVALALAACSSDEPSAEQSQPQSSAVAQSQPEQAQQSQQSEQVEPQAEQPQSSEQAEQTAQAAQPQPQAQQTQEAEQAQADQPEPAAQQTTEQAEQQSADEQQADAEHSMDAQASRPTLEGVPGIVDPSNSGWPREVEGLNGIVSIEAKPMRIINASIGHDEMTLALVPAERLVAVGAVSKDPTFSNIDNLVLDKPEIDRDPETIIAQSPDIVVTSEFVSAEVVDALQRAGIPVIQTALAYDLEGQINAILLMGYIYGEEERAFAFADEIAARYGALTSATMDKPDRPLVLSLTRYSDSIWTSGANSTAGGVIIAAGGINAAAEAGLEGPQTTSLEGVIAMAPEVIVIPQPLAYGGEEFRAYLLEQEVLAEVPAIQNAAVYLVENKHYGTLSYWNLRGAEALARILWPEDFPEPAPASFSLPESGP